jgi:hypothetical protein
MSESWNHFFKSPSIALYERGTLKFSLFQRDFDGTLLEGDFRWFPSFSKRRERED